MGFYLFPKDAVDSLVETDGWQIWECQRRGDTEKAVQCRKEKLGGFDLFLGTSGDYTMIRQYLWGNTANDFVTNGDATEFQPVFADFQKTYPAFKDLDLS